MIRFDIAVANRNRTEVFWQGWKNIKNFDPSLDRIVFFDTSDNPTRELAICLHYLNLYGLKNHNFIFLRRRSWFYNTGMILDYTRLVSAEILEAPQYTYFMQDHYISKTDFVAGDSIPENGFLDFNLMDEIFKRNLKTVIGCSRHGFRLNAAVPEELSGKDFESYEDENGIAKPDLPWIFVPGKLGSLTNEKYSSDHFIYYHAGYHIKGAKDLGINFDGCNFCCDPKYIVNHYQKNKSLYTEGTSDYGAMLVWEMRIGQLLYDQGLGFYELSRGVSIKNTEELKKLQPDPSSLGSSLWCYQYTSPLFHAIHKSDDVFRYTFKQTEAYYRYQEYSEKCKKGIEYDSRIYLLYDSQSNATNFKGCYPDDRTELFVNRMVKTPEELAVYNKTSIKIVLIYRYFLRRIRMPFAKKVKTILGLPKRVIAKIKRMNSNNC